MFGVASILTPFFLAATIGGVASGRIPPGRIRPAALPAAHHADHPGRRRRPQQPALAGDRHRGGGSPRRAGARSALPARPHRQARSRPRRGPCRGAGVSSLLTPRHQGHEGARTEPKGRTPQELSSVTPPPNGVGNSGFTMRDHHATSSRTARHGTMSMEITIRIGSAGVITTRAGAAVVIA